MSDHCQRARSVLNLYAEGELRDPAMVDLVRGHLRDCDACRDALERYDRLTRALLAGESEGSVGDRNPWTLLERERRVEGVLTRLSNAVMNKTGTTSAGTRQAFERFAPKAEPSHPGGRRAADGERLREDGEGALGLFEARRPGAGDRPPGGGRWSRADRKTAVKRHALAAAFLLGVVSLWLALVPELLPERSTRREPVRLASLPLPALACEPRSDRQDLQPARGEGSSLGWVVGAEHSELRLAYAGDPTNEPVLLYGVEYRDAGSPLAETMASSRSERRLLALSEREAEIEWIAEVLFRDSPGQSPNAEDFPEPRCLLVPVASGAPPESPAQARWFYPARVERRPRGASRSRVRVENSTIYRVYVYEGVRPLLRLPGLPRGLWETSPTFGQARPFGSPTRSVPSVPLPPFRGGRSGDHPDPRLRF